MPQDLVETYENGVLVASRLVDVPQEDWNARSLYAKAQQAIIDAENADANWDTLTAAQKDIVARRTMVAVAKLIRFVIRQLDSD